MASLHDQLSQLVYSTDRGRIEPEAESEVIPEGNGVIRIQRETKGRKGKGVTVLSGFGISQDALKQQAKILKKYCGVGGSVKDYTIEIQGDQRALIEKWLTDHQYRFKRVGG
ncbi:SUI1 family translation initiation factor [Celerinatantimonas yamalensis]|uniref:Stress response translation initiation inhibitor YciH n=1 Tax=Celerinatantimonas yamalensis TaxID=559956 RepID=A0ABW9G3Q1_9GAMM